MKKVATTVDRVMINHYKNILESEGIACKIRNDHLGSIVGEMPFTEAWPELWVINDLDYDRAKQLIEGTALDESPLAEWRCKKCGETNEGQFAACWSCGEEAGD
jgi:rubrerythrin